LSKLNLYVFHLHVFAVFWSFLHVSLSFMFYLYFNLCSVFNVFEIFY
jgi:hypothetical protein